MEVSLHKTSMHILLCQRTVFFSLFSSYPLTLKSTRDMIEKIDITDTSVINAITRQLNIKNIRNEMFPTWRLTLQPGEEYDLGTAYYGAYLVRNSDSGAAALIMVGAGVSSNILLSDGNSISTDFTAGGKIILNKKTSNGNVYVKMGEVQKHI